MGNSVFAMLGIVLSRPQSDFFWVSSQLQQTHDIARHLANPAMVNALVQTRVPLRNELFERWPGQVDLHHLLADPRRVAAHVLIPLQTRPGRHIELVVVPAASEHISAERSFRQWIPLVRTCIIHGMNGAGLAAKKAQYGASRHLGRQERALRRAPSAARWAAIEAAHRLL